MRVLIACGTKVRDKIVQQLAEQDPLLGLQWANNIYQAIAAAIVWQRQEIPVRVCVQVDTLDRQEMQVFRTLAQMESVSATAFSAFSLSQDKKLAVAQRAGAMIIPDLSGLCDWLAEQDLGPVDRADAVLEEILDEATGAADTSEAQADGSAESDVVTDRVEHANRPVHPVAGESGEPLLSDDELKALLGTDP